MIRDEGPVNPINSPFGNCHEHTSPTVLEAALTVLPATPPALMPLCQLSMAAAMHTRVSNHRASYRGGPASSAAPSPNVTAFLTAPLSFSDKTFNGGTVPTITSNTVQS
eukprot:3107000-Amphidinium_carterae.1